MSARWPADEQPLVAPRFVLWSEAGGRGEEFPLYEQPDGTWSTVETPAPARAEPGVWACVVCGPIPANRGNWCDLGCGRDYNRMEWVTVEALCTIARKARGVVHTANQTEVGKREVVSQWWAGLVSALDGAGLLRRSRR